MPKKIAASASPDRPAEADAVSRSAFRVMAGGGLALVAGLASQVVVAAIFGAAADMDAYLTALVVPTYLAYVLISGLSFVLIPAFVQEDEKGSEEDAWAMVGTCFWITLGFLLIAAVAGSFLARQIIDLTAPGFRAEKAELAANMLAVMMFTVPCTGLMSLMSGIQNARGKFFWPAAAQGIGSLGNVVALLVLHPATGPMSLAWGNLVAAILSASVPTFPILTHGWKRLLPLNDARIIKLGVLILPFIVFGLVTRSVGVLERYFASNLPDGDLSYLGYASKISSILVVILAASIASAIFPTMAREYARRRQRGLAEETEYGLRLTFATGLPALTVCGAVALPLVMVLFERGEFDHATSIQVSRVLLIVILYDLLFRMVGNMIGRTLYVINDTLTNQVVSALAVGIYIPLAKVFTDTWGFVGLALAQAVEMALAILVVILVVTRKVKHLNLTQLGKDLALYLLASLAAGLGAWSMTSLLTSFPAALQLLAGFVAGGSVYLLLMFRIDRKIALSLLEMVGAQRIHSSLMEARTHPAHQLGASTAPGTSDRAEAE